MRPFCKTLKMFSGRWTWRHVHLTVMAVALSLLWETYGMLLTIIVGFMMLRCLQARFLLAKLNPSATHQSDQGLTNEIIFTEDVALNVRHMHCQASSLPCDMGECKPRACWLHISLVLHRGWRTQSRSLDGLHDTCQLRMCSA